MPKRLFPALALAAYSAILLKLVVFKNINLSIGHLRIRISESGPGPANFLPFKSILYYLRGGDGWGIALFNLVGNIVLFIPVGLLAPFVFPRMTWRSALALAFAAPLAVECIEVVFRVGLFDVDDILLNGLGIMIGFWASRLFIRGPAQVVAKQG